MIFFSHRNVLQAQKKEYQKLFFRFEGHLAPLLSVVLDPKAEYAASASCDGSVKIWKIESQSCLKTWKDCWAKSNDLCRSPTPGQIGKLAFLECIFLKNSSNHILISWHLNIG